MINSNELRIGNYITVNEVETYVTFIIQYHIGVGKSMNIYKQENVYPILITEEWLLKLNAELYHENGILTAFDIPDFGGFEKFNNYFKPKPYYFSDAFNCDYQLRYVHELQNIYFALMQKELNFVL